MRISGSCWTAALVAAAMVAAGCSAATGSPDSHSVPARPKVASSTVPVAQQTATASPAAGQPRQSRGASPRIMIVGDSITQGSSGDYTWQYWLYEHLKSDGISPEMVGPAHWLYNNVARLEGSVDYANPNFGHSNDTTWGMTLSSQQTAIGPTVASYRPGYLLVLLGLDDLFWFGVSQPTMLANLDNFIASAQQAQPHIRIVFGLVPPNIHTKTNRKFAAKVKAFNASIVSTAAHLSTAQAPIAVAKDTDIDVSADLWDGTHPNTNGQIKIAAAFADALAGKFSLGSDYPTPFPVMPVGPLTHSKLTVTPALIHGSARLSWTLVPGANGYFVYLEKVSDGQTSFRRLPYPLTTARDPFTAGLLSSGAIYAFKIQACKGTDCGAFSNVVRITAP
jgi:lysophospholipase L1-like esterase